MQSSVVAEELGCSWHDWPDGCRVVTAENCQALCRTFGAREDHWQGEKRQEREEVAGPSDSADGQCGEAGHEGGLRRARMALHIEPFHRDGLRRSSGYRS